MDAMERGRLGEAMAAEYLRKKGYKILAMNYRTRLGEIDVIAQNRRYLVFAEVKLRKNADFAQGREYVTARKQQRLICAAQSWLQRNPTARQPRFDVLEIYASGVGAASITHLENAFELN